MTTNNKEETINPTVEVGKSYLHRHDVTMSANIEFVSKKGHIIANLESRGEEITNPVNEKGEGEPYGSETFVDDKSFFDVYYPSEEGKKKLKEFTSKIYNKL